LYVEIAAQEKIVEDSLNNLNSVWNNALTQAAESFRANVSLMMQEFEDALVGTDTSIEHMREVFDQ
jgi:hypothetical protein